MDRLIHCFWYCFINHVKMMYDLSIELKAIIHRQTACGVALCASWELCSFATCSEELKLKIILCDHYT